MGVLQLLLLAQFLLQLIRADNYRTCGSDKHCVPYDLCNEDGNGSLSDEEHHCHYMEKCCHPKDVLPVSRFYNESFMALPKCGSRLDPLPQLRPSGGNRQQILFAEFPWLIAIYGAAGYLCSGALITPLVVITAAHCVQRENLSRIRLVAGEWDAAVELEPLPHQTRTVAELVLHPNYTQSPAIHNLALLLLDQETPFQLAHHVQAICLPSSQISYDARQCYVSGWQRGEFHTNQALPRQASLSVLPKDQCATKLRLAILGRRYAHNDTLLCTGGNKDNFACSDLGAIPLMCQLPNSENRFQLAGLLARATRCDGPQLLGIYTNVSAYRQWIDQELSKRQLDNRFYMLV